MRFVATAVIVLVALGGCATRQPVWRDQQRFVNVSGKDTARLSRAAALDRMLAKSARVTVDHGYRYFAIIRPVPAADGSVTLQPSGDLTIRLFRNDETKYPAPGVWDAYGILAEARKA